MPNASLKIQSFTTDPGHTPNDGTVSADFRGANWIGSPEGDEHHALVTIPMSDSVAEELLLVLPKVNQALATGEAILPAGVPHVRFGIWDINR